MKDLLNLLIVPKDDVSSAENHFQLDLHVSPSQTPLSLMTYHLYHPQGMIPTDSIQLLDVCYKPEVCAFIPVPNYLNLITERGIHEVVRLTNRMRKDFGGERFLIEPSREFFHTWEDWKLILTSPWKNKVGKNLQRSLFGKLLILFAEMHNFTMDTVPTHMKEDAAVIKPTSGIIAMATNIRCRRESCMAGPLSLYEFNYLSTLTYSKVVETAPAL